jgi:HAD superfamily hydrolase (TIGR01509 family)
MSNQIQAVIFDCDGTLVDSEVLGMDLLFEMACERGASITRQEAHQLFRGVSMASIVQIVRNRIGDAVQGFEDEFIAEYRKASFVRFQERLRPIAGALEVVSALHLPFAVATNGPKAKAELTLSIAGLLPYFGEAIYSGYDHGCFKPDPRLFLIAASGLGIAPQNCAVVEDSIAGIEAGLAAGMRVFSLYPADELPSLLADQVISLPELRALLTFLGNTK